MCLIEGVTLEDAYLLRTENKNEETILCMCFTKKTLQLNRRNRKLNVESKMNITY
jgi:hypothetical protein